MNRIYHPYWEWEEYHAGMWRAVSAAERSDMLQKAIEFTGNHKLYGKWMMEVPNKWPKSCEHNLTDISQNRRAWIGHAAVCLAIGIPEDIVREAWGHLTTEQQRLANLQADAAIEAYEQKHHQCQRSQLELTFFQQQGSE